MRDGSWALVGTVLLLAACAGPSSSPESVQAESPGASEGGVARSASTEIVQALDREPTFTQGLELLDDGTMLHSRGLYGQSGIDLLSADGTVRRSAELPDQEFGEGLTVVPSGALGPDAGPTAYQLTWKSGVVHTWSVPDLVEGPALRIDGEGWGLCFDDTRQVLWQSDGSSTLRSLAPADLSVLETVEVAVQTDGTDPRPVDQLNELECVEGRVWANVWKSNDVVQIDPDTGAVAAVVDLSVVVREQAPTAESDVLNGLAYDDRDGTWVVTGKNWDRLYRLDLVLDGDGG
ncbi:MAG: glutaminyl-peptide cyclotransferase [Ornithinimicrobium sp.]